MPILNYTTKVPPDRTASEIMSMLAEKGANQVMMDFGDDGYPTALRWLMITEKGPLSFALPVKPEAVYEVLTKQRVLSTNDAGRMAQAHRTAWRIIKEWTAAQMALIETEMVSMDEVFLPYMLAPDGETTVYQVLSERQFKALPAPAAVNGEHHG